MLKQYQGALAKAQNLETELGKETIEIDKGPVKATFNGLGELQKISIDKDLLKPEEADVVEDLIVSAVRDGFQRATELRTKRMQEIMPNIPGM